MIYKTKKLGDICTIVRGGSPRPIKKYISTSPDGFNWIKISDATASNKYIYKTQQKIKKEGATHSRIVKINDLILSNSMSFGRPYIMKINGCVHDGWLVISNYQSQLDMEYLYYLLSSEKIIKQFKESAKGSTVKNLNIKLVSNIEISYPPISEQKQIVAKLDKIFFKIDELIKINNDSQNDVGILFKKHLTKIFSEGEKDWSTAKIGELCDELFAGGDVQKNSLRKYKTGKFKIPIFTNGEKNKGLYGFTDKARVFKPSITVSARGTIGYSELRTEPFYPAVRLIVITPNTEMVETNFLKHAIKIIDFSNTGSSIPQLTVPMIRNYKIKFPKSKDSQKKIILKLNILNSKITELLKISKIKMNNYYKLKQSFLTKKLSCKAA